MEIAYVPYKSIINGSNILKPNYHLNYGKKRIERAIKNKNSFTPLGDAVKDVYTGGIFKRVFVDKEEFGLPYISAQHMMNLNPLQVAKTISKKYTPRQDDMSLSASQILVSCAGTVGNVRLIGEDLDGVIGSQDIIRVISDDSKTPYGFIYAYLASPTAYNYIQSFIYGSVVPRIEPKTLANLPVPNFSESKIKEIHDLIVQASSLRVESNNNLKKAHTYFDKNLGIGNSNAMYYSKKSSELRFYQNRLDASFNIQKKELDIVIKNSGISYCMITDYLREVFIPNRGKRTYVKQGLQYLSTSNIATYNPTMNDKYLSLKMKGVETLRVKKNWILIARSGQEILGSTFLVGDAINNLGVNEHALRVIVDEENTYYIYGFLSSNFGKRYLRAGIFGSAILTINEDYIKELLIPELSNEEKVTINSLVSKSIRLYDESIFKENQAITLVEKEIESWQK
jgi:type I restriction enzyme S subunit